MGIIALHELGNPNELLVMPGCPQVWHMRTCASDLEEIDSTQSFIEREHESFNQDMMWTCSWLACTRVSTWSIASRKEPLSILFTLFSTFTGTSPIKMVNLEDSSIIPIHFPCYFHILKMFWFRRSSRRSVRIINLLDEGRKIDPGMLRRRWPKNLGDTESRAY